MLQLSPYVAPNHSVPDSGLFTAFDMAEATLGAGAITIDADRFLFTDAEYSWEPSDGRWRIFLRCGISVSAAARAVRECLLEIGRVTDGAFGPPGD